jgi:hypothetical protein
MRGNSFLVCSAYDEISSAYAQHAINANFAYKNQNFEKPSRNLSNRTKVKILIF